ncbi:tRNA (adenosine(37)-N6)-threonylcarbamoyltransferase complex ATPase subunit type 1 TsaE [Brachybacterium sp. JHP9]|uniref:tRNA threonylcarbamoyladenosine biosynthesis protein TsaE n=1 Tax=Brachybacterium equifaecis TaxID=2910770 RepID=A0ABT0QYJ9_9MICO|nr:tRNA (adenosine(37)-N6)-threonylcarbamoyltransferase complex ATPase subunit type 1 TsaE [Brachybacterium equifaecis]
MSAQDPAALDVATTDAASTRDLARRLAAVLRGGDLLVLDGPLGAGKTTFTQGLGEGLGVRGPVASPTFVIARVHPSLVGGPELVHVDAYRLGGSADLEDLDLDSDLDRAVTVVEWGRDLAERLADSYLLIELRRPDAITGDDPDEPRTLRLVPTGPRWDEAARAALAGAVQISPEKPSSLPTEGAR